MKANYLYCAGDLSEEVKLYINDLRHGGGIVLLCISPFYDKYQSIVADPKHYDADPDLSLHFGVDPDMDQLPKM
jgi:hypothetical protein